MESWARPLGIDYLDGAIMNYPIDIGKPQGTVVYSGPDQLFNRVKPVLLAFGDNAIFVGKEIGQASATDIAGLSFGMAAFLGFLHGYIVYEAENLPVDGYLQIIKKFMPAIEAALADMCHKIQGKDYGNAQASLETWAVAPRELIGWCEKHGVNHTFADPQLRLIERAVKAGKEPIGSRLSLRSSQTKRRLTALLIPVSGCFSACFSHYARGKKEIAH